MPLSRYGFRQAGEVSQLEKGAPAIGIFILCILIYVFYLIDVVKPIIALIAILCLVLHWTLDFLTNITLPFRPFNMKVVNLFFKTKKSWIIKEFVLTFIFAILFGLAYFVF